MLSPENRKAKRQATRLAKRDITVKKSGTRVGDWFAKGTVRVLSPLINKAVEMGFDSDEKRLQRNVLFDQKRLSRLQERIDEKEKQLTQLQQKLNDLKPQVKAGNEESRKQFLQCLQEYSKTLNVTFSARIDLRYAALSFSKSQQKLTEFQKNAPKTKKLLTKNLNVMLSLFTGLRSAYSTLQGMKSHTACEVTIPPFHYYDSSGIEYALRDIQLFVDKMSCDEQGNFVLSIPRCRGTIARGGSSDTPSEKVEVNVGLTLKVKAPLGETAEKILACGLTSLKSAGMEMSGHIQKLFDEGKRSVTDFMDVSFDQASVATSHSEEHPLITRAAVSSLLQVLSPLIHDTRSHVEEKQLRTFEQAHDDAVRALHIYRESADKYQQLIDDMDQLADSLDGKEAFSHKLAGMIPDLKHQRARIVAQQELARTGLTDKKNQLLVQNNRAAAAKNPKPATLHNLVHAFFGVQKVMDAQSVPSPVTLSFPEQHLRLSPTSDAVLKNTKAQIKAISLDESGSLQIEIPVLTTSMQLTHEGQVYAMPDLKARGVMLNISPPLGQVIFEAANFEMPVTMGKLVALVKTYQSATSRHKGEDGFPSPKRFSDYCQLSVLSSSCTLNGEEKIPEELPERVRLPFEEPLEAMLLKTIGLDDPGCQQVTRTLAMAASGMPPQELSETTLPLSPDTTPPPGLKPEKPKASPKHKPHYELEARPDEVFGKMSPLQRWLVGPESLKLQFSRQRSLGRRALENTKVYVSEKYSGLRRLMIEKLVRKALKNRRATIIRGSKRKVRLDPENSRRTPSATSRRQR